MSAIAFETDWNAEMNGDLGSRDQPLRFDPGQGSFRQAEMVRVRHQSGAEWVGLFSKGDGALSGVWSHPSADRLVVVSGGWGYIVSSSDPKNFEVIEAYPATQVVLLKEPPLVLVANETKVVAYSGRGLAWRSPRLSWAGVTISKATQRGVEGKAWDAVNEKQVGFHLDAHTGAPEGGSSP